MFLFNNRETLRKLVFTYQTNNVKDYL